VPCRGNFFEIFKFFSSIYYLSRRHCQMYMRDIEYHAFREQFVTYACQIARHGVKLCANFAVFTDFVTLELHDLTRHIEGGALRGQNSCQCEACFTQIVATLLSRRSRQQERFSASVLSICSFVCLSVCPKCKKRYFFQKLRNLEPWSLLTTYRKSGPTWAFQRTHYWTRKIQDGVDPPSWIFTPKCKNAMFSKTKQFRALMSIDDL